jgi:DNA repair exonuclease SbcCD ATPase subunit
MYAEYEEYDTLLDELEKIDGITNGNPDSEEIERITNRLEELDKNQEMRDQLAQRYNGVISNNKASFLFEYGPGVEHEKCKVCGQSHSYLYIVEDHFFNPAKILYEISGWFCADCIINGRQDTHTSKALRELMQYRTECDYLVEKYESLKSVMGKLQSTKAEKKFITSNLEQWKKLKVQELCIKIVLNA